MSNPNIAPNIPHAPTATPASNAAVRETFENVSGQIEHAIESPSETSASPQGSQPGNQSPLATRPASGQAKTKTVQVTPMPETEEELRKVLHTKIVAITKELDQSIDQLKKQKKVNAKQLHDYIKRRRSFTQTLRDLATMAMDALKDVYHQFFPNKS